MDSMDDLTRKALEMVMSLIEAKADEDAANAGFNGEHGDRGASTRRAMVNYYRMGMSGVIPNDWHKMVEDAKKELGREQDPEYREFKRLQAKFRT